MPTKIRVVCFGQGVGPVEMNFDLHLLSPGVQLLWIVLKRFDVVGNILQKQNVITLIVSPLKEPFQKKGTKAASSLPVRWAQPR